MRLCCFLELKNQEILVTCHSLRIKLATIRYCSILNTSINQSITFRIFMNISLFNLPTDCTSEIILKLQKKDVKQLPLICKSANNSNLWNDLIPKGILRSSAAKPPLQSRSLHKYISISFPLNYSFFWKNLLFCSTLVENVIHHTFILRQQWTKFYSISNLKK